MVNTDGLKGEHKCKCLERNKLSIKIAYVAILFITITGLMSDSFNLSRQKDFFQKTNDSFLDLDNRIKAIELELIKIK